MLRVDNDMAANCVKTLSLHVVLMHLFIISLRQLLLMQEMEEMGDQQRTNH